MVLSMEMLADLITLFGLSKSDFYPSSTWFSYGSNLSEIDFRNRMKDRGYELGHLNPIRAKLDGWRRELANASKHGLAYTIVRGTSSTVEGLLHEVPVEALPAFLRKEGVLDPGYRVRSDATRSYDIIKIVTSEPNQEALTLFGRCPKPLDQVTHNMLQQLKTYVEVSLEGAKSYQLNCSDMISDLGAISKSLRSQ